MAVTVVAIIAGCAGYIWLASGIVSNVGNRRIMPTKCPDVRIARENRLKAILTFERRVRAGENCDAELQHWLEFDAKMNRMGK